MDEEFQLEKEATVFDGIREGMLANKGCQSADFMMEHFCDFLALDFQGVEARGPDKSASQFKVKFYDGTSITWTRTPDSE